MPEVTERHSPNAQRARIAADRAAAQADHERLAYELSQNPANTELADQVASLEAELAEYDRREQRIRAAEAEANRRASFESRIRRRQFVEATRATLNSTGTQALAALHEAQAALEDLAGALLKFKRVADERRTAVFAILVETGNSRRDASTLDVLARLMSGEIVEEIARQVAASGLGTLQLEPYVVVSPPSTTSRRMSFAEAIQAADARLFTALDRAIQSMEVQQ